MTTNQSKPDIDAFFAATFARLDVLALSVALGVVVAVGLFLLTVALLLHDAPPGMPVGPRLATLGEYLPGYSVTWPGSFIALGYGWLIGAFLGFLLAVLWNVSHHVYSIVLAVRANW